MNKNNKLRQSTASTSQPKKEDRKKSRQERREEKRQEQKAHLRKLEEQKKAWDELPPKEKERIQNVNKQISAIYELLMSGTVRNIYFEVNNSSKVRQLMLEKMVKMEEEETIQLEKERQARYTQVQEQLCNYQDSQRRQWLKGSGKRFEEVTSETEEENTEKDLSEDEKEEESQFYFEK